MSVISLKKLLESGAHLGHTAPKWHPKMKPYIYGKKGGVHIIDLRITMQKLKESYDYVKELSSKGEMLLFVGTKAHAREAIKREAERSGNFYVNHRWLGGFLTNFNTIRQSMRRLSEIEKLAGEDHSYPGLLKKEAGLLEKERVKIDRVLGGIRRMHRMPAAIFIMDIDKEKIALSEARKLGIPVIAVTDTNTQPDLVDYAIPCNDDSIKAIELVTSTLASASLAGSAVFEKKKIAKKQQELTKVNDESKSEDKTPKPKVTKAKTAAAKVASAKTTGEKATTLASSKSTVESTSADTKAPAEEAATKS